MCRDTACPLRASCLRYLSFPTFIQRQTAQEEAQSYFRRSPRAGKKCQQYRPAGLAFGLPLRTHTEADKQNGMAQSPH